MSPEYINLITKTILETATLEDFKAVGKTYSDMIEWSQTPEVRKAYYKFDFRLMQINRDNNIIIHDNDRSATNNSTGYRYVIGVWNDPIDYDVKHRKVIMGRTL